ncbi:MAG: nucleoside-diphosphate-sugar epimerase [Planctomycetota bacterium]|jgi:nucleoside-diphosphate-sugar epimerase
MSRVLVTGANGFVGQSMTRLLLSEGFQVRAAIREKSKYTLAENFPVTDRVAFELDSSENDYVQLLDDVQYVVHLAARVHMDNKSKNDYGRYLTTNVEGTKLLAEQAARQGVKRFIFLSTIKVNGEFTAANNHSDLHGFNENDLANPQDGYSQSKFEAEQVIRTVCQKSKMELVILRSPLIYGPGVKANFLHLLKIVDRGFPLPLASIENLRSIIFVENLCKGILACLEHADAANELFLISDCDVSVPELIRKLASAMRRKVILIPFPITILRAIAGLIAKSGNIERLTQSLVINNSKIRKKLNWSPSFTVEEGLASTVDWYRLHP